MVLAPVKESTWRRASYSEIPQTGLELIRSCSFPRTRTTVLYSLRTTPSYMGRVRLVKSASRRLLEGAPILVTLFGGSCEVGLRSYRYQMGEGVPPPPPIAYGIALLQFAEPPFFFDRNHLYFCLKYGGPDFKRKLFQSYLIAL